VSKKNGGIPSGWARTTIGEIGEYYNGRGFKKAEWSETGRPIIRIQNLTDPTKPFNHYEGDDVDPRNESIRVTSSSRGRRRSTCSAGPDPRRC
jgi:hypothetical protein